MNILNLNINFPKKNPKLLLLLEIFFHKFRNRFILNSSSDIVINSGNYCGISCRSLIYFYSSTYSKFL